MVLASSIASSKASVGESEARSTGAGASASIRALLLGLLGSACALLSVRERVCFCEDVAPLSGFNSNEVSEEAAGVGGGDDCSALTAISWPTT